MEKLLMGIDLGTSGVKCLITDTKGNTVSANECGYPITVPREGFAEQDPHVWWTSAACCVRGALASARVSPSEVLGVGLSGQMHGAVLTGGDGLPLRGAIIHCDARAARESGFQASSLLWVRNNEPEVFKNIRYVMSPKDYIRLRLTGEPGAEYTDASATGFWDMEGCGYSQKILEDAGIDVTKLPVVRKPHDVAGAVTEEAARATGLRAGTPVVYGAADQPAQALGNGVTRPGSATSTIGTGGQIFAPVTRYETQAEDGLLYFSHAPEGVNYVMGAILAAGSCLEWWCRAVLGREDYAELDRLASTLSPEDGDPVFLPYMMGERNAGRSGQPGGMFHGLRVTHDARHMYRAVMEGVALALRAELEAVERGGARIERIVASGGGANSPLWLHMQADIYGRPVRVSAMPQQAAALGAAVLAGVGCGVFTGTDEACRAMARVKDEPIYPVMHNAQTYQAKYRQFLQLRRCLREVDQ